MEKLVRRKKLKEEILPLRFAQCFGSHAQNNKKNAKGGDSHWILRTPQNDELKEKDGILHCVQNDRLKGRGYKKLIGL